MAFRHALAREAVLDAVLSTRKARPPPSRPGGAGRRPGVEASPPAWPTTPGRRRPVGRLALCPAAARVGHRRPTGAAAAHYELACAMPTTCRRASWLLCWRPTPGNVISSTARGRGGVCRPAALWHELGEPVREGQCWLCWSTCWWASAKTRRPSLCREAIALLEAPARPRSGDGLSHAQANLCGTLNHDYRDAVAWGQGKYCCVRARRRPQRHLVRAYYHRHRPPISISEAVRAS